jgi:hypothetical protein
MKKQIILILGVLLVLSVAWAAFAQPQGGGGPGGGRGFGRMREAQTQALAALQEQIGKLKALMEQAPGARGTSFQDMTDEERTKMMEEMTKRREEQQNIMASMQTEMDKLKGVMVLMREQNEAMQPLKDVLASAEKENATATAGKLKELIAQRDKEFQDKMTAMGVTSEQMDRYQQMMERGGGRGFRGPQ